MAKINAIQTHYKGYKFRSRLEARWAVFFDALDVNWEYEVEGYSLGDGLSYLPDFRISAAMGVVCRPDAVRDRTSGAMQIDTHDPSVTEWDNGICIFTTDLMNTFLEIKPPTELVDQDAEKCTALVRESGDPLIVAFGDPYRMHLAHLSFHKGQSGESGGFGLGEAAFVGRFGDTKSIGVLVRGAGCEIGEFWSVAAEFRPALLPAMTAARSARFEHGETPRF